MLQAPPLQLPWPPALVVVLGAIPGAWMRYAFTQLGCKRARQGHWATWGVNMLACALLGLLVGLQPRWPDESTRDRLELALATGFLGSLSTYSTLLGELVRLWHQQRQRDSLNLAAASLLGGLLACLAGLQLARGSG